MRSSRFIILCGLLLAFGSGSGCIARSTLAPLVSPDPEAAQEHRDLAYYDGEDADAQKHRLNVFVPAGEGPHPVVVFAHGGGWFFGDRVEVGDPYTRLGRRLSARGILTVVISYRLAPAHRHPAHIQDVSRAIAWTFAHAQRFGGDPKQIHLMGHSAGAHLVTLAASDPQWLAAHDLHPDQLAGVIALSAPLDVHHLGRSFPTSLVLVHRAFGRDPKVWREASPVNHLRRCGPPLFVAWADGDFDVIRRQGHKLVRLLRARGQEVEAHEAEYKGHFTLIMDLAEPGDVLGERVVSFVVDRSKRERSACR